MPIQRDSDGKFSGGGGSGRASYQDTNSGGWGKPEDSRNPPGSPRLSQSEVERFLNIGRPGGVSVYSRVPEQEYDDDR